MSKAKYLNQGCCHVQHGGAYFSLIISYKNNSFSTYCTVSHQHSPGHPRQNKQYVDLMTASHRGKTSSHSTWFYVQLLFLHKVTLSLD